MNLHATLMRSLRTCLVVQLVLAPPLALAEITLKSVLDDYLQTQTQGLPGKVRYSIGALDPRVQLAPCSAFEPFLPHGTRLWGQSTVGVRCLAPASWTVYVPVQVSISGKYLLAAKALGAGKLINADDFVVRNGDLNTLPTSVITEPAQALGKTMKHSLAAGQPLRAEQLIEPWAVQQGQRVKLVSKNSAANSANPSSSFSVSSEGSALNNAVNGQLVQVRVQSGQAISGTARTGGIVEVSY